MEFDEEKITKLSSELFNALRRSKELADLPKDEFLSNPHFIASAKSKNPTSPITLNVSA